MKIIFLSYNNHNNINEWSGTPYYFAKALEKTGNEIIYLDNLYKPIDSIIDYITKFMKLSGYFFEKFRFKFFLKLVNKRIEKRLIKIDDADLIFSFGSTYISFIQTKIPIIMWSDATFNSLINSYYKDFKLANWHYKTGEELERLAFDNASRLYFSSDWAINSAINHYNVSKSKISLIQIGANMKPNYSKSELIEIIDKKSLTIENEINLLFIGKVWELKGGEYLLELYKNLPKKNKFKLFIVGSKPKIINQLEGVEYFGFLDKNKKEDLSKLLELYYKSHFFILPTKAEAFGIVFSEANSFGIPVFASRVGGIPSVIKENINGFLFDLNLTPKENAIYLSEVINRINYKQLALSSFEEYEKNLNWEVIGNKLKREFEVLLNNIKTHT